MFCYNDKLKWSTRIDTKPKSRCTSFEKHPSDENVLSKTIAKSRTNFISLIDWVIKTNLKRNWGNLLTLDFENWTLSFQHSVIKSTQLSLQTRNKPTARLTDLLFIVFLLCFPYSCTVQVAQSGQPFRGGSVDFHRNMTTKDNEGMRRTKLSLRPEDKDNAKVLIDP